MISFKPLWETMKLKGITTYYLRNKCSSYCINGSTIRNLKAEKAISTNTLNSLCKILQCSFSDIMEYTEDEEPVDSPPENSDPKTEYSQTRKAKALLSPQSPANKESEYQ